jgi:hypothetical protein
MITTRSADQTPTTRSFLNNELLLKTQQQVGLVIRKVRKTQHQNPEFGHTLGEIQNKTCKTLH